METESLVCIDPKSCNYCGLCAKKCPTEAISVNKNTKTWHLDKEKCLNCLECTKACPKKCMITFY